MASTSISAMSSHSIQFIVNFSFINYGIYYLIIYFYYNYNLYQLEALLYFYLARSSRLLHYTGYTMETLLLS